MSQYRKIINARTGQTVVARAEFCTGFFGSWRGLMCSSSLTQEEGIIFERRRGSRISAAMHTLGMRYNIGIIWLDRNQKVIEMRVAQPWRLAFVPARAAKYVIEALPDVLRRVAVGDLLCFDEVAN